MKHTVWSSSGSPIPGLTASRRRVSHVHSIKPLGLFCSMISSRVLVRCEPGRLLPKTKIDMDIRRHYIYPCWAPESSIPTPCSVKPEHRLFKDLGHRQPCIPLQYSEPFLYRFPFALPIHVRWLAGCLTKRDSAPAHQVIVMNRVCLLSFR